MLDEMLFRPSTSSGRTSSAAALLVLLVFVKNDAPWLYELGMEIYRAMLAGDRDAVITAHKQFGITMEIMMRSPWSRDIFRDDEDGYMVTRYFPEVIQRTVDEYLSTSLILRKKAVKTSVVLDDGVQP